MTESAVNILLVCAAVSESVYILFRTRSFTIFPVYLYSAAVILCAYNVLMLPDMYSVAGLSGAVLLFTSKNCFRTGPYEKPDYRYLIILAGIILMRIPR